MTIEHVGPRLTITEEPCSACPFKGRFDLHPGRLRQIMDDTTRDDAYFSCHKTVDYGMEEDGEEEDGVAGSDAVFGPAAVCSGWLKAAETIGRVPSVVQIAQRLGLTEERHVG